MDRDSISPGQSLTRRNFLAGAGMGVAGVLAGGSAWGPIDLLASPASGPAGAAQRQSQPNVVFIICDDLNDTVEGMGGHPQAHTPNIDRLMRRGVQFLNCQANCPICAPSRASLWSGLYPHTTGYFGYQMSDSPWRKNPVMANTVTVFEHAVANGYRVYATGKIHHDGHEDWSVFRNKDGTNGFSVKPSWGPFAWDGDPKTALWGNNSGGSGRVQHPFLPNFVGGWDGSFGPVTDISKEYDGHGQWTAFGKPWRYVNGDDHDPMPDERCAKYASEVLAKHEDGPVFLAVGFNRPHAPLHVPKKYFDMFPLEKIKVAERLDGNLKTCAKILAIDHAIGTGSYGFDKYKRLMAAGGEPLLKRWTQAYLACVAFVDEQIGKVLDAVEKSPAADNTLLALTSDNGYHMGQKDQLSKNSVWEESTRVPLAMAGPGVAKDKKCDHPVSLVNMYPTLVDYCKLPNDPNKNGNRKPLAGHSIRALLEDPATEK